MSASGSSSKHNQPMGRCDGGHPPRFGGFFDHTPMSAFGGKADIRRVGLECPLIAISGHIPLCDGGHKNHDCFMEKKVDKI